MRRRLRGTVPSVFAVIPQNAFRFITAFIADDWKMVFWMILRLFVASIIALNMDLALQILRRKQETSRSAFVFKNCLLLPTGKN